MLPARIGAALALIGAAGAGLASCGDGARPPASPPDQRVPDGVLSPEWSYRPASAETASATGELTVEAGIDAQGPSRTLHGARGLKALTHLQGETSPEAKVGERTIAEVMGLRPDARPVLHQVTRDGGLCGGQPAQYVVWYEPEMIEGRELVIAAVQGARPGETGSTVCRVLRYTRERGPGRGGSEEAR
jgi:hypothetical protein